MDLIKKEKRSASCRCSRRDRFRVPLAASSPEIFLNRAHVNRGEFNTRLNVHERNADL